MPSQSSALALERFTTFGDLLKFLRRRAGLTQRELSIAVGYSHAQISRLELNQRLPDLATVTARFVPALDLEEEPAVAARLLELATDVRREDAPASGQTPYKGLRYFDENDADLFFGREALTARLLERLTAAVDAPAGPRLMAVVGASGSGKSSLVRAGLIPAIRWSSRFSTSPVHCLTPTARPLHALAASLTAETGSPSQAAALRDDLIRDRRTLQLASGRAVQLAPPATVNGQRHLVLVIDQFEELFTLCREETERRAFIDNLVTAASEPASATLIVLTLRADFYAHCAPYAALREALARCQEYIGPMDAVELRRAIEAPAQQGGWSLEPGLVDVLLREIGADGPGMPEPGALPLLSHALLETWQRRRGRTLTLSGYLASGGVRGAIAETADIVYHDELDPPQQLIARSIFLRLTEIGEDQTTAETRRRATLEELIPDPAAAPMVRAVLTRLADARLITTAEDTAEVAHEALIREWPTLRGWLEADREGLRLHRHLTLAAEGWARQARDPGELYRGARLAQAHEWAQANPSALNLIEREFLEAARAAADHEAAEHEAQRQRELNAARALAEVRGRTAAQLRRRALFLSAAFIVAIGMAVAALYFGEQARRSALLALDASYLASTREMAAAAVSSLEVDPERGILLALQAIETAQSSALPALLEAEAALRRSVLASHVRLALHGHEHSVLTAVFSPDGTRVAAIGQDGTVKVWDGATGQERLHLPGHTTPSPGVGYQRLAFSPDGAWLAAGDADLVRLYDGTSGGEVGRLAPHAGEVWSVAFSPDGKLIASGATDGVVRVWEAASGNLKLELPGHTDGVGSLAFSPDGAWLASGSDDGSLKVWDAVTGDVLFERLDFAAEVVGLAFGPDGHTLAVGTDAVYVLSMPSGEISLEITVVAGVVAFSPDGQRLAVVTGSVARLFDGRTGQEQLALAGHTDWVTSLAFSPDGRRLVTGSFDRTVRVWDITADQELLTLEARASAAAFSPDGQHLATAGIDGVARVWRLPAGNLELALVGHSANLWGLAFSPDGQRLATGSSDWTARVWDLASGTTRLTLEGHTLHVRDIAYSPDGRRVATASFDGTARIWDAATGAELLRLSGHQDLVVGVAFSPDGRHLATAGTDGRVVIWDLATGTELLAFTAHDNAIPDLAYSPDGQWLATASRDATAKIWDAGTGSALASLSGHRSNLWSIAFSPDGQQVATGSADNTARIWDAASGQPLQTFLGSQGEVTGVAFHPNGEQLAVTSSDGVVRLYLLQLNDLLALARSRVTRTLTPEECRQFLHQPECPAAP